MTRYYKPVRHIPDPTGVFPIGTRVRHDDGAEGVVVRIVAGITGSTIALIRWDDRSSTRTGDDHIKVIGTEALA